MPPLDGVTPGPWQAVKHHGGTWRVVNPSGDAELGNWLVAGVRREADAEMIASLHGVHVTLASQKTYIEALQRRARAVVDARFKGDSWEDLKDAIAELAGLVGGGEISGT